jgi:membrane-associated protease RseP (regulator of RpoE activity)
MEQTLIDPLTAPDQVRSAVSGLIAVESYMLRQDGAIVIEGRLLTDPQTVFRPLRQRMEAVGFTPFLRSTQTGIQLLAIPGVIKRRRSRVMINLVLFVVTVVTVLWTGAGYEGDGLIRGVGDLARGLPFALSLLGILGTHEMGHFIMGRLRGAPVSWPYFIPIPPFVSFTGTMGAVIVQREPLEDRRTLLEVGIAGPLAGLVVAIPLLFYGLATSAVGPAPPGFYIQEGNSLLYAAAKYLVFGQMLPANGLDVQLNTIAWAAWIGLLITMFNLLPVGQLDGGHIAYALLGRRADYLAYSVLALCGVMGVLFSYQWIFWGLLATFMGVRHPPPFNDVPTLGKGHAALAIGGIVLFFLLLMPAPLTPVIR